MIESEVAMLSIDTKNTASAQEAFLSWLSYQVPESSIVTLSSATADLVKYCESKVLVSVPFFENWDKSRL